jgi:CRISPR-associated protein Cmr3
MLLEIKPLDTVFFRNARPFSMGEDTWADSMFPPNPSVLYGALRTVFIQQHSDFNKSAEELTAATENLRINGIFIRDGQLNLFPVPLDLVQKKGEPETNANLFNLSVFPRPAGLQFISSGLTCGYQTEDEAHPEAVSGYFKLENLNDYIAGAKNVQYVPGYAVVSEPKIGIKLNNATRSTNGDAAGSLYRVELNRMADTARIIVDCDGMGDISNQVSRLGGEGKLAIFRPLRDTFQIPSPAIKQYFKIYLSTPAFFRNGWIPGWLDENMIGSPSKGIKIRLLAAATGRPVAIGGWDMKAVAPKTMLRAVPAGSVYCFEILEGDPDEILQLFHRKSISENIPVGPGKVFESAKEGFGISFVAVYTPVKS